LKKLRGQVQTWPRSFFVSFCSAAPENPGTRPAAFQLPNLRVENHRC
jgi:hypothetical protein